MFDINIIAQLTYFVNSMGKDLRFSKKRVKLGSIK
jgi:hypothetical protein